VLAPKIPAAITTASARSAISSSGSKRHATGPGRWLCAARRAASAISRIWRSCSTRASRGRPSCRASTSSGRPRTTTTSGQAAQTFPTARLVSPQPVAGRVPVLGEEVRRARVAVELRRRGSAVALNDRADHERGPRGGASRPRDQATGCSIVTPPIVRGASTVVSTDAATSATGPISMVRLLTW